MRYDPDAALAAARASEARWTDGQPLSALDGVPGTLKENIASRARRCRWAPRRRC